MKKQYPITDHFDGRRFSNTVPVNPKSLLSVLRWKLAGGQKTWQGPVQNEGRPQLRAAGAGEVVATFINHATYLFQFQNLNLLVDPVFSERASPFAFAGPARVRPPGVALQDLPKIDVVLVTHNHYDHMDIDSLKKINALHAPTYIVPLANQQYLNRAGITKVHELDWWQSYQAAPDLRVTLTPAQHWSARGVLDRFEALWGGFMIETGGKKIFWAGDTGYGVHFKRIRTKLGIPDLSFLPIGAYEPRWFMKDMHMNPADAVQAHMDLETPLSVGMHYGTFQLTDEDIADPLKDLERAKLDKNIKNFITLKEGETRALSL